MPTLYGEADWARETRVESKDAYRSPARRDYARLLHCPAFRRLQGKTQLFPGAESDFFRNRLTHSLEVAQIAKSIALRINSDHPYFQKDPIDLDLVETAALGHDLGHPPFGHNGERALDECMREKGGFEGNAQTLRILARLEKKELEAEDADDVVGLEDTRVGLNLTYRTLAGMLKYDKCIPRCRDAEGGLVKGYYESERKLVERVKEHVCGVGDGFEKRAFMTIECQIMDIADDIAYSTYDLEDALKTRFVSPMSMISALNSQEIVRAVMEKTDLSEDRIGQHVTQIWLSHLGEVAGLEESVPNVKALDVAAYVHEIFESLAQKGTYRTAVTSGLVNEYVEGVDVTLDESHPALSVVTLNHELRERVGVVKNLTYQLVVNSLNLKTVEYRGGRIVKAIFDALSKRDGDLLLPEDYREQLRGPGAERERTICDFIAAMTDRYALEFFGRLNTEAAQTIFKPL